MPTLEQSIENLKIPVLRLVELFSQKKQELARLRGEVDRQDNDIALLDKDHKGLLEARRDAVWNKVVCVQESGNAGYIPQEWTRENVLQYQDQILELYERFAGDGLGRMSLFLRTKDGERDTITLSPQRITLSSQPLLLINNPFKFIFEQTDRADDPPGLANFERFWEKQFLQNFETNDTSFYLAYGPSGAGKTTLIEFLLDRLLTMSSQSGCTVENKKLYPLVKDGKETYRIYAWRPPQPGDVTKIALNDIEMIQKVGVSLHQYSRDLYRLGYRPFCKSRKWIVCVRLEE